MPGLPKEPCKLLQYTVAHIQFKLHRMTKILPALKDTETRSLQLHLQEDQGDPEALLLCAISCTENAGLFANKCRHARHHFLKCGQEIKGCSTGFTRHLCSMLGTLRKWRLEGQHPVSTRSPSAHSVNGSLIPPGHMVFLGYHSGQSVLASTTV